jgi:hypothetical protein
VVEHSGEARWEQTSERWHSGCVSSMLNLSMDSNYNAHADEYFCDSASAHRPKITRLESFHSTASDGVHIGNIWASRLLSQALWQKEEMIRLSLTLGYHMHN